MCVVCGCETENNGHALWDCEKAQAVWKLTRIMFDTKGMVFPEFIDLLWHLKFGQRLGEEIMEIVIMVAWGIWH